MTKNQQKESKKEPVKKVAKEKIINQQAVVRLTSFTMKAVIPTMQYGNLQPEITVEASSIEEASTVVLPYINWLFEQYSEATPKFLIKQAVAKNNKPTVEDLKDLGIIPNEDKVQDTGRGTPGGSVKITPPEAPKEDVSPVSEAFTKAKKAIDSSMSIEATQIIEDQIQKSVKLTPEEKPKLLEAVLLKRKEINSK